MTNEGPDEGATERSATSPIGVTIGEREPQIRHIVLIALVAAAFGMVYFVSLAVLNTAFWKNDFVAANRWTFPVLVLFFSLLVGLCGKYLHAPNMIRGGMQEQLKGGGRLDFSTFPGALLSSFFSLLSGASVGPEGPLTTLVVYIAMWFGTRLKLAEKTMLGFIMAGLASAFNGLIGNPLFTALFATELQEGDKQGALQFLTWNLVAGAIGYIFFALIGFPAFASSIPFTPVATLTIGYALLAIVLGIIGALVALFIGISFQVLGKVMDRLFTDRFVVRVLSAGVIIAIVAYFLPDLMFSGEAQIQPIIANPAAYGVLMLLAFAILKVLLLALSFKSGYLGGPIFPTLFASTMIALAISLLFPGVPLALLFTCTVTATIAIVLRAPLASILLVVTIATSNFYELGYVSLATATALIIGGGVRQLMEKRAARRGGSRESGSI